jgi:hypothetical protein
MNNRYRYLGPYSAVVLAGRGDRLDHPCVAAINGSSDGNPRGAEAWWHAIRCRSGAYGACGDAVRAIDRGERELAASAELAASEDVERASRSRRNRLYRSRLEERRAAGEQLKPWPRKGERRIA